MLLHIQGAQARPGHNCDYEASQSSFPTQLPWVGDYLGPLLCQGYQEHGSSTAGVLTDADMESC